MPLEFTRAPWFGRALPFALYIAVLAVEGGLSHLLPGTDLRLLYGAKIACVALALTHYWKEYAELRATPRLDGRQVVASIVAGFAVFLVWINFDQPWAVLGTAAGFSPLDADGSIDWPLATLRIAGAVVVVPVMEELFWRSLVMRWIDRHDFLTLAPARISLRALLISSTLFGLEHREFGAGIVAGLAYGYLYKRFSNLWAPVLAHAVTNGILGLWVLHTRNWQFW
jgi:CAAX prenyl protease-like protein